MRHIPIEDSLDLHTFRPEDVVSVVEEYVRAAAGAGWRHVRLIHGRGRGVQRGMVRAALERHPLVEACWDAPESHLGATMAALRVSLSTEETEGTEKTHKRRNGGTGGRTEKR
jgi:DNA-nicking Smr family endonuclease